MKRGNWRNSWLEKINNNIARFGYHVTSVLPSEYPGYQYTVGLHKTTGFELVFAGCSYFTVAEKKRVINQFSVSTSRDGTLRIDGLGVFRLREVDVSWYDKLLLGVVDLFPERDKVAYQICPDPEHWTIDEPDMLKPWTRDEDPVWQYLFEGFDLDVSKSARIITNLDALQGYPVTEVVRWEEDEWEAFSGNGEEVTEEEMRIVPVSTFINFDKTLMPILSLKVGEGLHREGLNHNWNEWQGKEESGQ